MNKLSEGMDYYNSSRRLEIEREQVFFKSWLMLCHQSEIPELGNFLTFEILGEPIVLLNTPSYGIKCFFNICIHRGYPLFHSRMGQMSDKLKCGYHGWEFNQDGLLSSDRSKGGSHCRGLKELSICIWQGYVFVAFEKPNYNVEEAFGRWDADFVEQGSQALIPTRTSFFETVVPVNWKFFMENTLEGHHVSEVHSGLHDLVGTEFHVECFEKTSKTIARINDSESKIWSVRMYQKALSKLGSNESLKTWSFYYLYPNVQITICPDQISYLMAFPLNESQSLVRGRYLTRTPEVQDGKIASYLNLRLGKTLFREDAKIFKNIQKSFQSKMFAEHLILSLPKDRVIEHFQEEINSQLKHGNA